MWKKSEIDSFLKKIHNLRNLEEFIISVQIRTVVAHDYAIRLVICPDPLRPWSMGSLVNMQEFYHKIMDEVIVPHYWLKNIRSEKTKNKILDQRKKDREILIKEPVRIGDHYNIQINPHKMIQILFFVDKMALGIPEQSTH